MLQGAQEAVRQRLAVSVSSNDSSLGEWREVYGRVLLRLDLEPLPEQPFRFHADMRAMPGFALSKVSTSGMRATRTANLIADGSDDIGLVAVVEGTAIVNHNHRQVELKTGEAVLLRSSEPGHVWFPSSTRYVNLAVPAKCLGPLVPNPDAIGMTVVKAHSTPLRLALRYALLLLEDSEDMMTADVHHLVANHFRDLAAAMIDSETPSICAASGIRAARLKVIKAYIVANLADHDLSVVTVAAIHGITPRYVGMLFEGEGTSFSQFVLNKRLACVYQALADPRLAHHSISSIVGDAGFGDISHFNRAFRRRYGATPSDVRAEA